MASEVISTALLMIATVVAAVALINAVFPSIYGMSGSIQAVTNNVNDRMKTEIQFIYETPDSSGNSLAAWVKNTGQTQMTPGELNDSDLFISDADGVMQLASLNSSTAPCWTYTIENGNGNGIWGPGETLEINLNTNQPFVQGNNYDIRLVLYNGAYCEDSFSV
jgi:archaeal flagellar protein FlaG